MSIQKLSRFCVLGTCLGYGLALPACGDDDSPPEPPVSEPDAGVSSSSMRLDTTSSSATPSLSSSDAGGSEVPSTVVVDTTTTDAGATSSGPDSDTTSDSQLGLLEGLSQDPETSQFAELIARADIEEDLNKDGPFTVFAPTNDGLARLPEGYLDSLTRKQVELLVRSHLVADSQSIAALVEAGTVLSVLELPHQLSQSGNQVYVDGLTRVVARNQSFSGNMVHKVDSVLTVESFPGTLAQAVHAYPRLSELETRLSEQDLDLLAQDDKTLFAPINGGFDDLAMPSAEADAGASDAGVPVSGMSYHVLSHKIESPDLTAGVVRSALGPYLALSSSSALAISDGIHDAQVLVADLRVASGSKGSVIHVVEEALVAPPPVDQVLTSGRAGETFVQLQAAMASATVPGTSESYLSHVEAFDGVTIVAPSDAAFGRITGEFGVDSAKVVGFHIMDEVVDSARLLAAGETPLPSTLSESAINTLGVVVTDGGEESALLLEGFVQVVARDIPAANGVIHVIDGVLVPQDVVFPGTTLQALTAYPVLSKMNAALSQSGLLTSGTSTLFAPFDSAFGDVASPTDFVRKHAVSPGVRDRATFGTQVFTSLSGESIEVDAETLTIGDVHIVRPDLLTHSGVVHVMDGELGRVDADAGLADSGF